MLGDNILKRNGFNLKIGRMLPGDKNQITDVPGVRVGHRTLAKDEIQTGVTVIMPVASPYNTPCTAAVEVLNGFGKSIGLMQVEELGSLESPIALTNTLNAGLVADALVAHTIHENGDVVTTFNPLVLECNDSYLNAIRRRAVCEQDVFHAIAAAKSQFEEGAVGGGRGMSCFGLKGGIGSASRRIEIEGSTYTLGVLVQSNFGKLEDFQINGFPVGDLLGQQLEKSEPSPERGSIIVVMATDLPLSSRQIKRIIRRASIGIARTGGYMGNGSGEVVIGFTTANTHQRDDAAAFFQTHVLNENHIDQAFRAMAESTEQAILSALLSAETVIGVDGHVRESLADKLKEINLPWEK